MEITTAQPFDVSLIIASTCNLLLRKIFLKQNLMAFHSMDTEPRQTVSDIYYLASLDNCNRKQWVSGSYQCSEAELVHKKLELIAGRQRIFFDTIRNNQFN